MHEFVPVLKKFFVPSLRKRKLFNRVGGRLALKKAQPPPDASFRTTLPLDRVLPGPRLQHSPSGSGHLVAFNKVSPKVGGAVCSVGDVWKSNPFSSYNKMKCWIQFLTTPTADTPGTTLVLHFDAKRYLIGHISEGTQRAAIQRKMGLLKVSDILLTGKTEWKTAGGLLGMILTIADSVTGSREDAKNRLGDTGDNPGELSRQWLNIHGSTNLTHMLATARRFVFRKGLPIHTQEFRALMEEQSPNWEPSWQDDLVKVWAMPLEPGVQATSSRKRSHEEFSNDIAAPSSSSATENKAEQEDQDDQVRKGVVADMFSSTWRLDTLVTKKLSQVVLPATIFYRNEEGKIEKYQGPLIGDGDDVPDINVLVRNPWPGALIEKLPPTKPAATSVSYIVKGHPQRGKFLPQVAKKLGVKPGPLFAQLTQGKSVTTDDGTVITPEQVMEPGKEGGGVAIIDLPDKTYVDALVTRKEWMSKDVMNGVGAIVWILGPGVLEDLKLQTFMEEHKGYKHIVSSTDTTSNYLALESPSEAAIRLHLLDPERFPIPVHSNIGPRQGTENALVYEPARVGKTIQLEPKIEIQDDGIVRYLNTANTINAASKDVQKLADEARKEVTSQEYLARLSERQKDIPSKDAEVITLGTGSALPSKYRNVSATLLRVPGFGCYLFDCGENTLGQLKRVFGDELPDILCELKAIWISHLHADHHLGTASVIRAWNEQTSNDDRTKDNKLIVASDKGMIQWLREYSEVESFGYDRVEPITMGASNKNFHNIFNTEQTQRYGLESIQACHVDHCNGAMAVVFNFPNGFKVSYSGDCRPSRDFVRIGNGSTLLIHEATFDDELIGDAMAKKHCTTSEALDIGRQMGARRILLTHFSQRYQKIPVMQNRDGLDQVAIVAFDYMRARLEDFAKMEAFKPALMKLYEDKE
jgi:ribonuclease Z